MNPLTLNGLPAEMVRPSHAMPLLGRLLTWSIGGVALRRDQLVAMILAAGLDDQMLPTAIQTRSCVLRTLDRLQADGFVRRIVEAPDRAIFVLVSEAIDRDREDARYQIERRFEYNKRSRTVVCDDPATQAQIDALMDYFADAFLPADIRRFVLEVVKDAGAIALRQRGGVYFVAEPKLAVVEALVRFFDALGAGCSLLALNVPRSPSDVAGMVKAFEAEALGDLEGLAAELADLEANAGKVRPSTWAKRLQAFKAQRDKVNLYATLLETEAARYVERLADLERRVHAHLVG